MSEGNQIATIEAERDRLQQELASLASENACRMISERRLIADRDADVYYQRAVSAESENDRLRAALEVIGRGGPIGGGAAEYAREALKGQV